MLSGQADATQQAPPPQQQFLPPPSIRFDAETLQKIGTLMEQQQTILREIRSLQSLFSVSARGQEKGGALGAYQQQSQAQFAQVREQMTAVQRRVEDVLQNVIRARNQYETMLSSGDTGDGGSWTTYALFLFCAAGIGSVVVYNMRQQSKERFNKMI